MKQKDLRVVIAENQGKVSPKKARTFADIVEAVFSQPDIDKKYQEWLEKKALKSEEK